MSRKHQMAALSGMARRARQQLVGGLLACQLVGLAIIGIALGFGDQAALVSSCLGFLVVIVFFGIGQAIEIVACELEPTAGMAVVLASYALRVIGIGAGMVALQQIPAIADLIAPRWLAISVCGCVVAWLGGVIGVAVRQRVPIYDKEYFAPLSND